MIYVKDIQFIYITNQLLKTVHQNVPLKNWKVHGLPLIHYGC